MFLNWLALIVSLILGLAPIILTLRFRSYIKGNLKVPPSNYTPPLSVIVPCKGIDPNFEKDIISMLLQDYPDFEVIFVTATSDDPAYSKLKEILLDYPKIKTKLVVAGLPTACAQKNNNLIKALEAVRESSEVFTFFDSDLNPEPDFLKNLIAPLADKKIGATTGYRWYSPIKGGLGSFLRSIWNGGALPLLVDQRYNFTFGGTTAIRREVFDNLEIKSYWKKSAIDDLTLSSALKKACLLIHFVPRCITATYEDSTLAQTIEFTNRQTIFMRIYHQSFWLMTFITYALVNFLIFGGILLLLGQNPTQLWCGLIGISVVFWQMLDTFLNSVMMTSILPSEVARRLKKNRLKYILLTPLASLLFLYNSIFSLFRNSISWRGVVYKIKSPYEIIILKK